MRIYSILLLCNLNTVSFYIKYYVLSGLVPLDTIQEAMGSMGPWHIVIAIAISLVKFPVAWHQLSIVFLAPPTNFSCIAPLSATNESRIMRCEVDVGNGTIEKCTDFIYDKQVFRETIITQVSYYNFIRHDISIFATYLMKMLYIFY